jgi:ABC-2 type transport system ATP-binding protein
MYLEARNITKNYINHKALDNVTIEVPEQSIFGLLGPNGAGKTTLIRIINMITMPDQGEVLLGGKPITRNDIVNIGYMPEERGLYKKMKVGEQAVYLARLKGLSKIEAEKRLRIWFNRLEISSWWNKKVEELSKGMQQKVQFIVTVLHEPKLLIFDEPFSGFDPINVNILKKEIKYLNDNGSTIIFSTHNMASVEEICDNIALINKSENVLSGDINEIKKRFKANRYKVVYNGDKNVYELLNKQFLKIIETGKTDGNPYVIVEISDGKTTNDLLSILISEVNIIKLEEVIPSLNDIFIQVVNQNTSKDE